MAAVDTNEPTRFWKSVSHIQWRAGFYERLFQYLEKGFVPPLSKDQRRRLFKWAELFEITDGQLVLVTDVPFPSEAVLGPQMRTFRVLATQDVDNVIKEAYREETTGYRGVEALFQTLRRRFLNIYRKDVHRVLGNMESRRLGHLAKSGEQIPTPIISKRPMERVQIDLMSFPESFKTVNNGYLHVLVAIDHFTKFCLGAWPLKKKDALPIARHLQQCWSQFGPPERLTSDGAKEFMGFQLQRLAVEWGYSHIISEAYDKSQTSLVERMNRTLRVYIENRMSEQKTKIWWESLPFAVFGYNSTVARSIKMSPFNAMFRRHSNLGQQVDAVIRQRLNKSASRMVKAAERRYGRRKNLEEIRELDTVRVRTVTFPDEKRLSQSQISARAARRRMQTTEWSKTLYVVTAIQKERRGSERVEVVRYLLDNGKRYRRSDLKREDIERLIRPEAANVDRSYKGKGGLERARKRRKTKENYEASTEEEEEANGAAEEPTGVPVTAVEEELVSVHLLAFFPGSKFGLINAAFKVETARKLKSGKIEVTLPPGAGTNDVAHNDEDWQRIKTRKTDRDKVPDVVRVTEQEKDDLNQYMTSREIARAYPHRNLAYLGAFAEYRDIQTMPGNWFFLGENRDGQVFDARVTGRQRKHLGGKKYKTLGAYFEVVVGETETWLVGRSDLDTLLKANRSGEQAVGILKTPDNPIKRLK